MSIVISPHESSDQAALEAGFQVVAAARAVDLPDFPRLSRQQFEGGIRYPMPGRKLLMALATIDDVPVGHVVIHLPQVENVHNASLDLVVHPDHRRRGVGRALYAHAVRALREQGRKRIIATSVGPLPEGPERPAVGARFAAALGARPALVEVRRRLVVDGLGHSVHDALLAEARERATGYRTITWQAAAPEEYVADIGYLDSRLVLDSPTGDLVIEPDRIDADRVRGIERVLATRGWSPYHCGVVHEASNRLVAWTMVLVLPSSPRHADQQITIVDPQHRGHRLGLLAKLENLRHVLAHEPELSEVDTWNAADNEHMIAINEQLGFRPVDAWTNWQLDL
ncbi:Acetyltransferase (GNAT) family protein [Micromonospora pallida]|uniref:Acetyltransferase (GNAT) family protein n=1 Tax=Micromonospora pallida TaxID=145854 RepID=A0A1C6TER8_9ACTN|nr:GNAT family N-acetyltransferase [Micromonospora pallida]SCL40268.1 Acetyltransferase (GNAT) family protein [Micromonospora pallida]